MEFEEYARQRSRQLLRLAMVITADAGTAEDAVQEVLIRAHTRWARIDTLPHPHAYLRRMVVNECLSWRRKWGRIEARPDIELDRPLADHGTLLADRDALAGEIAKLSPKIRAAIVLRYYEDLSDIEIAEVLSCRAVTVRGYIHRGLKALRIELAAPETGAVPPSESMTFQREAKP
ncbi:MAG: SigE family RNA polymerase sigma factor [Jatrophihabitans sp.]